MKNNIFIYIIVAFLISELSAQKLRVEDSLICLNDKSHEILQKIILENNKNKNDLIYKRVNKYLRNFTIQEVILFVEDGNIEEPNTDRMEYIISKQIAAFYIISSLYYKDSYLCHNFNLYDSKNKKLIDKNDKKTLNEISSKIRKWIRKKNTKFPLSKEEVFWEDYSFDINTEIKKYRIYMK